MYTTENLKAVSKALGSKAQTVKGVVAALKAASSRKRREALRLLRGPVVLVDQYDWEMAEAERVSHPAAKRARKDTVFRRSWLRRLREELRRINRLPKTIDEMMVYADDHAAVRRTDEIRHELAIGFADRSPVTRISPNDVPGFSTIPIGSEVAKAVGFPACKRGSDWGVYPTFRSSHRVHEDPITEWKNDKPRTVARAVNDTFVRAFAQVNGNSLDLIIHETRRTITLPEGYAWTIDQNGVAAYDLASNQDDYHLRPHEFLEWDGEMVCNAVKANRETRKRLEATAAALVAEVEDVWVSACDSLRAGNCRQGTIEWARQCGLSISRHYRATDLLKRTNQASRVKLAIKAAAIRHKLEMERGYAELEDHMMEA